MKKTALVMYALAAIGVAASPALAQEQQAQPPAHQAAAAAQAATPAAAGQAEKAQAAEQAEKSRLEAAAAARTSAARRSTEAQAKRDLARAQADLARAQEQAQREATRDTSAEIARVEVALKHAQRQLELYAKGTAALDTARYEKALQAFAEAAALKGEKADGALYWKAFAEFKAQGLKAALESLKEIQEKFPESRWLEHARALEMEVRHASGEPLLPAATPDEELKLIALNSLVRTDAEQALPALEKMLHGQQPARLKRRALFVVSQSRSPRAKEILASVAKSPADPDLQIEALQYLQAFGGPDDRKLLYDAYAGAADKDVKLRLIETLYAQGDATGLVDMARKETDPAMRKRIVERLSRMKSKAATDYMLELINK